MSLQTDSRVYDVDYLSFEELARLAKERHDLELLRSEHDCTWNNGFCSTCERIYLRVHEIESEVRNRS